MKIPINKRDIMHWLPRILSIVFIIFLSLFALDVFSEYTGWNLLSALFIHLLPSLVLSGIVVISWKYDLVGAIIFLSFSIFYIIVIGLNHPWTWYTFISGPTLIIAMLFLTSWLQKRLKH